MIEDWKSTFYKEHRIRIYAALLLGLIGIAASVATIYALPLEGAGALGCAVKALSCTAALTSEYAKIAGIPLGVFGVFYFAFWTLNLRAFQVTSNGGYLCVLSWITLFGATGSLVLFTIMTFVLKAPCFYCLITHLCNIGSFILLWPVRKWRMTTPFTTEHFRHFAALSAVAALAGTTLHFANQSRHLAASLSVRETALSAALQATPLEASSPSAELNIQPDYPTALSYAKAENRTLAIGFFDPG